MAPSCSATVDFHQIPRFLTSTTLKRTNWRLIDSLDQRPTFNRAETSEQQLHFALSAHLRGVRAARRRIVKGSHSTLSLSVSLILQAKLHDRRRPLARSEARAGDKSDLSSAARTVSRKGWFRAQEGVTALQPTGYHRVLKPQQSLFVARRTTADLVLLPRPRWMRCSA